MSHGGWYPRRRGILEHLERGHISLLDSAVHDFLCLVADYRTGLAWASAEKIAALCPAGITRKSIQRSLQKLERIGWLKRFCTRGKKGNYPIIVGRYFVRDASLTWKSVNLEKTTDWQNIQFDVVTDPSFLALRSWTRDGTDEGSDVGHEVSTLKEVRSKEAQKPKSNKKKHTHTSGACERYFEGFWFSYPESGRVNKTRSRVAYAMQIKTDADADLAQESIDAHKLSRRWREGFIPHMYNFLRTEQWRTFPSDVPR